MDPHGSGSVLCLSYPTLGASGLPALSYRIGGVWLTVSADEYVLSNGQIAIQPFSGGMQGVDLFILGDVFLRVCSRALMALGFVFGRSAKLSGAAVCMCMCMSVAGVLHCV